MPFYMVRNDITHMMTDAIVNPANEDLLEGSGTSAAIYRAAGEEQLERACEKIGHCDLGKAVATEAFEMEAKYIIHGVCPEWDDGFSNEIQILKDTYTCCLILAAELGCESIAFPLMSSGNLGFPKVEAMKCAVSAINDFLFTHEMDVYLVLYDREAVDVSGKLLGKIESYIDDNYIDENDETLPGDELFAEIIKERLDERRILRNMKPAPIPPVENAAFLDMSETTDAEGWDEEDADAESEKTFAGFSTAAPSTERSLEDMMEHLQETFSEMLLRLIDERGLKDSYVYHKANVDRRHFSKIRNNPDYVPTKKTVAAFIIALELSMDEAVDLMERAGYAFSKSSKFDVIICYFIENRSFDMIEINEVLFYYGQPVLGSL